MKTKLLRFLLLLGLPAIALATAGCQSPYEAASTQVDIETADGLKAHYKSPKDQHVEYDPATGKIVIKSTTNAELAAQAAAAQAESTKATAEALKALAEKLPGLQ